MNDLRQSDGWAKYLKSIGFEVDTAAGQKVFIKKVPKLGSVIKIQRPNKIPSPKAIDKIAKKYRALFVKIEPLEGYNLELPTFTPDPNPNLPTKTIVIDLTKPEEELWGDLSKDARQSVRKAQNWKLEIQNWKFGEEGFEEALIKFSKMLEDTGKRKRFWAASLKDLQLKSQALGKNALLFIASPPNKPAKRVADAPPVAGGLIFISGDIAFFHHISSTVEGQKLFAPYFLIWEVIKNLKSTGNKPIKQLDLEGIYDSRYPKFTRKWRSFTVFKKKWGGKEIEYPPPFIKHYNPITKIIFALAQALDRALIRA